jgi:hypothetical protein
MRPRRHARRKENDVTQKKMFKVISPIEKKGGGTFWMRIGSAFTNRDDSINIYLDALPRNFQLQIRELTEEELARRDPPRPQLGAITAPATPGTEADGLPF